MRWILALLLGSVVCVAGCGVANPTTSLKFNPHTGTVEFMDSKDNTVMVKSLTYNKEVGLFELESLEVVNNASQVRIANVPQLEQVTQQMLTVGVNFERALGALSQVTASLVPMLGGYAPNPVWGAGQPGAAPPGWIYVGPQTRPAE